ncbi:MAG: tetratricopeptide repeat protein, partial [Cyanobacteria bacterium J06631_2]
FRSKRGIPRFLGYLNLQRDRFKRDFPLSIVFLVPIFGIQYLIERTPDFFDWRSGFFRFLPEKDSVIHLNYPNYEKVIQEDINKIKTELLDTTTLAQELELDSNEYLKMLCKKSFLAIICKRYQKALKLLDKIIDLGENNGWTWNSRGNVLCNLQRYKEAVLSFDRCLEINPDEDSAWIYRGFALGKLKRYEEAISSYDKSLAINPDEDIAWFLRGNDLGRLERYEEAINSYDKCLVINPDEDTTWFNRGSALGQLERYEEAVASYDKGLAINPDQDLAWYDRACCLALLNQTELAIESWTKAINLNPKWLESAKTNSDFDSIRNDKRFQSLINSPREQSQ